ncbi:ABC-type nitrate/sulfonate/bicarbonate transport system permease component [Prauserella shujinwangii]|uniref:ABC-type nitrate/sulfonate/bicarbonate transport system permease component n=1 Tax=Prauserella shujinwangii TaxID=1453103 RepID=A0A2T0M103_9PSEU|nr:ABC transporter permease [Prauserella shujinwangii]PRX50272.1 ABC-type nitrate/sulfonate/bicarbonate transport system permease component [Prauserella shujinwangii]
MSTVLGFLRRWSLFLGLVVLWELATRLANDPFFPPPTTILQKIGELWFSGPVSRLFLTDDVYVDILPSLGRVLGGWSIAVVLGVGLGTALGRSRTGMDYVGPLFAFMRAIPPPTLIPVFLVLLSIGTTMKLTTIVFGSVWPILLNTVDGVRSVNATQRDTARSFRTPQRYWITLVVLPAALPKIFAGLRLSLSIALILMVVSEMVGVTDGIGFELIFSQQRFDFPAMWSWIVLLGALGYGLNALLLAVERRMLGWQQTSGATTAKTSGA